MQAAIGTQQTKRLNEMIARRTENAHYLRDKPQGLPGIERPADSPWGERVYFNFVVRLQPEVLAADMLNFALALAAEGVYNERYLSTTCWMSRQHLEPLFVDYAGYGGTKCPFECSWYKGQVEYYRGECRVAEKGCDELSWLASVHPLLEKQDLDDVADAVKKVAYAFVDKQEEGVPINHAADEQRALL